VLTRDGRGVSLWDARTLAPVRRFEAWGASAQAFSPDGKLLAIAHGDAVVSVFDVATGPLLRSSKGGGLEADCLKGTGVVTLLGGSAVIAGLGWSADASKIYAVYRETAVFGEF